MYLHFVCIRPNAIVTKSLASNLNSFRHLLTFASIYLVSVALNNLSFSVLRCPSLSSIAPSLSSIAPSLPFIAPSAPVLPPISTRDHLLAAFFFFFYRLFFLVIANASDSQFWYRPLILLHSHFVRHTRTHAPRAPPCSLAPSVLLPSPLRLFLAPGKIPWLVPMMSMVRFIKSSQTQPSSAREGRRKKNSMHSLFIVLSCSTSCSLTQSPFETFHTFYSPFFCFTFITDPHRSAFPHFLQTTFSRWCSSVMQA